MPCELGVAAVNDMFLPYYRPGWSSLIQLSLLLLSEVITENEDRKADWSSIVVLREVVTKHELQINAIKNFIFQPQHFDINTNQFDN